MSLTRYVATFRLNTPAFLAGADQQKAELRPPSFKGVLRFWFRAVAWNKLGSFEAVRDAEDKLFGSTRTGQASVFLTLRNIECPRDLKKGVALDLGRAYLAGLGLFDSKRLATKRPALDAGTRFEAKLTLNSGRLAQESSQLEALLTESLLTLGLFGGLGSRSRRGWGSLTLETLEREGKEIWAAPRSANEFKEGLSSCLGSSHEQGNEPPFTAFSANTRILLVPGLKGERSTDLHERLGRSFQHYRSYGVAAGNGGDRFVGQANALQLFADDHDAMLHVANGSASPRSSVAAPRRAVFGLPHNYYFKSIGTKVEVNAAGKQDRRASPLIFHIHQAADDYPPIAIVAFLPAPFLAPGSTALSVVRPGKGQSKIECSTKLPSSQALWEPVCDYLDELLKGQGSRLCERFPGAVEVTP